MELISSIIKIAAAAIGLISAVISHMPKAQGKSQRRKKATKK